MKFTKMKFTTFLLLIFFLDLITCETSTSVLASAITTSDQTTIESQLAQTETTTVTTTTSTPSPKPSINKTRKPSCRIVYKSVKTPSNHPSWSKDKLTMACTVCNFKGYKESCVYTDEKLVENSEITTQLAQESRRSVTIKSSTEPLFEKGTKRYVPVFETTASSTINSKQEAEAESREDENSGEESKDEEKGEKNDFYYSNPTNFVPKEYLDTEYDSKYYEGHDAAANVYHRLPYGMPVNYDSGEGSSEEDATKESRKSYRHEALPGFDEVRKVLPDVEPINVDKVKPRKRQKTIEYNEETSFSSDDGDDDNVKKSSKAKPRWRGMDSQGESTKTRSEGRHPAQRGGGYSGTYKPPFDMPAFDTKNCKVTYKESPSGGPKMKCMNCKDESNAYSEECGVEYEEPTKHREVFYNNGKYAPMKQHSSKMGYGSHDAPVHYYHEPYYGYSGGKKNSESRMKYVYMPFDRDFDFFNF